MTTLPARPNICRPYFCIVNGTAKGTACLSTAKYELDGQRYCNRHCIAELYRQELAE